jgi:tRNA threonylcarbamoyladenosine biosynthesis protein TsaE
MTRRETGDDGVRRLHLDDGTCGRLVPRTPWSWQVLDVDGPSVEVWLDAAEQWAAQDGVLDLRHDGAAAGFAPLADGLSEQVRAVPLRLPDAAATQALGRQISARLRAGDLLVLSGPLGAGKTTFTQGLGEGLGVQGRVTSPTFVLARVHRGLLPLVHVDAYRLRDAGAGRPLDLDDLDLDAALEDAVTVVEWGEGLVEQLTDAHLAVGLERPPAAPGTPPDAVDTGRTARVVSRGLRWTSGPADDSPAAERFPAQD